MLAATKGERISGHPLLFRSHWSTRNELSVLRLILHLKVVTGLAQTVLEVRIDVHELIADELARSAISTSQLHGPLMRLFSFTLVACRGHLIRVVNVEEVWRGRLVWFRHHERLLVLLNLLS